MARIRNLFFIIALALGIPALCLAAADQPLQWDPDVVRGKLDNGLTYFIKANKKPEKRVEIRLAVRAGSVLEKDGTNGIAHFIEHMGFNGTTNFKPGELVKYFESIGAEFGPDTNAYTSVDHTVYMLSLPTDTPEPLQRGIETMADYGGGMLFMPEEIDKERGIILEELRLGRNAEERIFEKAISIILAGTIYPNRLPIGKKEAIAAITQKDFLDYYQQWYRPDLMALVIVGDIDPAAVEKQIKDTFSKFPQRAAKDAPPVYGDKPHSDIYAGIITDPEMPVSAAGIVFTRPPSAERTTGDFRNSLIRSIALGIYNDRLNELSLKDKPPFKQAWGGSDWSMIGLDVVAINALCEMRKEKKALEALVTEVERIRRFGVLQEEVNEQKSKIAEALRAAETEKDKRESASIASGLADDFVYQNIGPSIPDQRRLFEETKDSIALKDIQDELTRLFAPENMSVILIMPEFQKSLYKEADLLKVVETARAAEIKPYEREKIVKSTDYSKLTPGKIVERKDIPEIGATRVKFENGLRVYFKSTDFQKDEIIISAFAPGGVLFEDTESRGATRLALSAWMYGGTKDLTSVQIDRLMSGKSIAIGTGFRENFSLNSKTVGKDFEETLQWMRDYLTMPGFRDEGVSKARGLLVDSIKQTESDQNGTTSLTLQQLICPGKPIAYQPSEAQAQSLSAEQVRRIFDLSTAPGNTEYTIVGNIDIDKAIELAAKYLGSIPPRETPKLSAESLSCALPAGYTRRIIYKGIENKTAVLLLYPGPRMDDPDAPAAQALAKVADIRMNRILREEMSGTYYAYIYSASNGFIRGRDFFLAGLATDPKRVDEMITAANKIFKDIAENGPAEDELKSTKEIFVKNLEEDLKRNDYWLGEINGKETAGLPLDIDVTVRKKVADVTPEQIKAVAAKYLLSPTRIELIALPESSAAAGAQPEKTGETAK